MKYKYTRKECNKEIETIKRIFSGSQIMPGGWLETVTQYLHATQLMLLAQKEEKKECKHNWKLTPDTWGETCFYCGKQRKIKTTSSPLEIEEIEEISKFHTNTTFKWVKLVDKVNQLISNQKKLYQLIKEKL